MKDFPRKNLTLNESIGSGAFATVYKGEAYSIMKPGQTTVVAVKTLKENATENDRKDFMKELSLFKALGKHENLVTMYGCCTDQDPVYLIMEYLPNGNLKKHLRYLISYNPDSNSYNNQLMNSQMASSDLLGFGLQIATGMEFLVSKQNKTDRSLKLIGIDRTFELSRAEQNTFGGSHPYPGMSSRKVLKSIRNGYRLPRPDHCDDEIYTILMSCWKENSLKRPTFHQLRACLEEMMEANQNYLQMDNFYQEKYLYLEPDVVLAEEIQAT